MFDKSLKILSIFLHGIRAKALGLQLIVGTTVVLNFWARVVVVFLTTCVLEKPYLDVICRWWARVKIMFFWWSIFFSLILEMVAYIRYEDQLDGMSNYLLWKVRMTVVLKEKRIWIIASTVVTDHVALDIHEVKEAKTQRLILDGIRDHLIPRVPTQKTAYDMWITL